MRISVIGTGYVGLVTGTCLAEVGHDVACYDVDEVKISRLLAGEVPIYEPGLGELVVRNRRNGRLSFTTDLALALASSQVCIIAVGTPSDQDGSADRRYVTDAVTNVARAMTAPLIVVIKSTVPVGTCQQLRDTIASVQKSRGCTYSFDVVSNPEFLKEGRAVDDFMRPDRIVVGVSNDTSRDLMRELYSPFVRNGRPILFLDIASSEMSKYAANVMLATRISLMNELAQLCDRLGADIMQVRQAVGADRRIGGDFLYPGIGYGGSCFPKDVRALSRLAIEADVPADILDAVDRVNRHQKVVLANRALTRFAGSSNLRFALWGLAFKANTDDVREAAALAITKRLTDAGAEVVAYDPEAMGNAKRELHGNARVRFAENAYEALVDADALIVATEWAQFCQPDFARVKALLKHPVIFDGRNQYDPIELERLGFEYHCIGRGHP